MSVVQFAPRAKPGSVEYTRQKGCFDDIHTEFRKVERQIAGHTAGVGTKFHDCDFVELDLLARRLAWITRQMLEADKGSISWDQALTNTFAVSAPQWLDYAPEFKARKEAVERKREDFFEVAKDICTPPRGRDIL